MYQRLCCKILDQDHLWFTEQDYKLHLNSKLDTLIRSIRLRVIPKHTSLGCEREKGIDMSKSKMSVDGRDYTYMGKIDEFS